MSVNDRRSKSALWCALISLAMLANACSAPNLSDASGDADATPADVPADEGSTTCTDFAGVWALRGLT